MDRRALLVSQVAAAASLKQLLSLLRLPATEGLVSSLQPPLQRRSPHRRRQTEALGTRCDVDDQDCLTVTFFAATGVVDASVLLYIMPFTFLSLYLIT